MSLVANFVFALCLLVSGGVVGFQLAADHYQGLLKKQADAAQQQREHADEVARQLARSVAGLHARFDAVRVDADLFRRSAAGNRSCLDTNGMRIANDALAGSKRTARTVPGPNAP